MRLRWPRRRWGFTLTTTYGDGHVDRWAYPLRTWTRSGAESYAELWTGYAGRGPDGFSVTYEISEMAPPVDVYADRYWRGDTYIGPEV